LNQTLARPPADAGIVPIMTDAWGGTNGSDGAASSIAFERWLVPSEAAGSSQSNVPVLIALPSTRDQQVPLVFVNHGTTRCKSDTKVVSALSRYAERGWVALSFDSRYHGERHPEFADVIDAHFENAGAGGGTKGGNEKVADGADAVGGEATGFPLTLSEQQWGDMPANVRLAPYYSALITSWRSQPSVERESPFIYDSAWDASRVLDAVLSENMHGSLIDPARIGTTGISLGGMISWFSAASDTRFSVAAPAIGVQGFQYALDENVWQARVATLSGLFDAALQDAQPNDATDGKKDLDSDLVGQVWDAVVPRIRTDFDAPSSLALIAPRPLLIVNGEIDPRNPINGVESAVNVAKTTWSTVAGVDGTEGAESWEVELMSASGVAHEVTPEMWERIDGWFEAHFKSPHEA